METDALRSSDLSPNDLAASGADVSPIGGFGLESIFPQLTKADNPARESTLGGGVDL